MSRNVFAQSDVSAIKSAIADRRSFRTSGNLSGAANPGSWIAPGWNHGIAERQLKGDAQYGIDYVLFSYSTPIAWLIHSPEPESGGACWRTVDRRFSTSTGKAQSSAYAAIGWVTPRVSLQAPHGLSEAQFELLVGISQGTAILEGHAKRTLKILIERNMVFPVGDYAGLSSIGWDIVLDRPVLVNAWAAA